MRLLKRLFIKRSTREIVDNISLHSGYPQTKNGLAELGYSDSDIKTALESKYINEYDFPVASFGDGETISYKALRLTKYGKVVAKSGKKNSELFTNIFWWLMGILSTVIGGLILAYVFGVGR